MNLLVLSQNAKVKTLGNIVNVGQRNHEAEEGE